MGYRDYSTAKGHIVDATGHGDFTTVGAALAAASAGETIFLRPGTYTEDITLKSAVSLVSFDGSDDASIVLIVGKCSYSEAGRTSISDIALVTNSDFSLEVTGSNNCTVILSGITLSCTNNTGINFSNSNSSSQIVLYNCSANLLGTGIALYTMSSIGALTFQDCVSVNESGSTTLSDNSAGAVLFQSCNSSCAISNSSTGFLFFRNGHIDTSSINTSCISINGNGAQIFNSSIFSGTASSISVGSGASCACSNCFVSSSNVNAISGVGSISYSDVSFGNSSVISVSTQTPLPWKPYATQGTSITATVGTASFNQADFTVTNGFVSLTGAAGFDWNTINQSTQPANLVANNGYICQSGGTGNVSSALPSASSVGDLIEITLDGATSWTITQAVGQQIRLGISQTTSGAGGSIVSTQQGDSLRMVCSVANLRWNVLSSIGNLTIV